MSNTNDQGPQNLAQAEAEALRALEAGAWRVWQAGSGPLPAAYARWCGAEVERATAGLRNRAEAAEAEVSAIKRAISDPENQPSQFGTVLVSMLDEANKRADKEAAGWKSCREAYMRESLRGSEWWRRMTAAEAETARLKALLVSQGPQNAAQAAAHAESLRAATPVVLPEHLAYLESLAEERSYMANVTGSSASKCSDAAHDLRAAVARRDGGAK